jgi:para-nitrobenzyl esterase
MKNIFFIVAILTSFAFSNAIAQSLTTQVQVKQGKLLGTAEDGLFVFKGIPFAKPPIGDLRWRAPQLVKKWEGVLQANKFAPGPMQGGTPPSGKSEDCLYLNVWTPAKTAKEKVPVLVWIYGGGFGAGATSETTYNGKNLAKKGVILVSIAYRVGQLGFMAHPELTAENSKNASGNYGLLDMIAGLQWVKENIAVFGGDPNKVTIFGESAGGIAVSMLSASPLAKGLFTGAISQSGGSFGPSRTTTYPGENMKILKVAENEGLDYMKSAGVTSIEKLRAIEADKLPAGRGWPAGGGWPIVDGWVIPDDQYKLYEAGKYNDTPILVGYNSDEGASFTRTKDPKEIISNVELRYGPFAERLLKAYPVEGFSVPKTARDLSRDAAFGWQTWSWAKLQAKTGKSKVFFYYFDQHPDHPKDSPNYGYGSPHGQEVAYVFENLDKSNPQTSKTDLEISNLMGTYWTNFAKYGNPNGKDVPNWPAFTNENAKLMYFNNTAYTGPVPSEKSLEVLDSYFSWRRTPEGAAWAK